MSSPIKPRTAQKPPRAAAKDESLKPQRRIQKNRPEPANASVAVHGGLASTSGNRRSKKEDSRPKKAVIFIDRENGNIGVSDLGVALCAPALRQHGYQLFFWLDTDRPSDLQSFTTGHVTYIERDLQRANELSRTFFESFTILQPGSPILSTTLAEADLIILPLFWSRPENNERMKQAIVSRASQPALNEHLMRLIRYTDIATCRDLNPATEWRDHWRDELAVSTGNNQTLSHANVVLSSAFLTGRATQDGNERRTVDVEVISGEVKAFIETEDPLPNILPAFLVPDLPVVVDTCWDLLMISRIFQNSIAYRHGQSLHEARQTNPELEPRHREILDQFHSIHDIGFEMEIRLTQIIKKQFRSRVLNPMFPFIVPSVVFSCEILVGLMRDLDSLGQLYDRIQELLVFAIRRTNDEDIHDYQFTRRLHYQNPHLVTQRILSDTALENYSTVVYEAILRAVAEAQILGRPMWGMNQQAQAAPVAAGRGGGAGAGRGRGREGREGGPEAGRGRGREGRGGAEGAGGRAAGRGRGREGGGGAEGAGGRGAGRARGRGPG